MEELRELTVFSVCLRILVAVILSGLIGMERGMKRRPAGLRTYMLVCVGACLVMLTNQYIFQVLKTGDPVRLGAQVVSGIGFLGAGTIIVTRRNQIKGLTTAAGLWAAAGVGLALGIGFYEGAIAGSLAIFVILTGLNRLDNRVHKNAKLMDLYVELSVELSLGSFMSQIREMNLDIESIQMENENALENGVRAFITTVKAAKRKNHALLLDEIRRIEGIIYLEEL